MQLEHSLSKIRGTRSVYSERNTGGYYIDITPNRDAIARYGLTVQDVQDVIEAAIGGIPIEVTIEGRSRFTINVRYPRDLRQNIQRLKDILVPISAAMSMDVMESSPPLDMPPTDNPSVLASLDEDAAYQLWDRMIQVAQVDDMGSSGPPTSGRTARQPASIPGPNMSTRPPNAGRSAIPGSGVMPMAGRHVPLGQIADIAIVTGPPMIKDEAGMLVGYVYVDLDQNQRDIGGYVKEAKQLVNREIALPPGYYLAWTGQFEQLELMTKRMQVVIPITLIVILLLLYINFRNLTESLIVLASVHFALVGSIWLMYFLGYNFSTATWVGIIALAGLATETGIVMVLYLDQAYERRKQAGKMRDLNDIVWAHMEGTVMRVRPKLMTVSTTMIGLVPLLWAQGAGADVMKRIAAPMVGGLISSTFLTLEIIPVIYTYWRYWQIRHGK
jgi:Cu(I)/Ag(I) efflux system membrane protein CusA/SilA